MIEYKVTVDYKGDYYVEKWHNKEGELHREGGKPAVIYSDGKSKQWWINGNLHRENGPAVIWDNGEEYYYANNELHREDGPAIIWPNGHEEYWLNDVQVKEEDLPCNKPKEMTVREVSKVLGFKIKIVEE